MSFRRRIKRKHPYHKFSLYGTPLVLLTDNKEIPVRARGDFGAKFGEFYFVTEDGKYSYLKYRDINKTWRPL